MKKYLKEKNDKKRLTEKKAIFFLKQIISGFKRLHEKNIIHRDFKSDNLLLHEDQIKIADFGFSKQLNSSQSVTQAQLGTPYSMAPEIHEGK